MSMGKTRKKSLVVWKKNPGPPTSWATSTMQIGRGTANSNSFTMSFNFSPLFRCSILRELNMTSLQFKRVKSDQIKFAKLCKIFRRQLQLGTESKTLGHTPCSIHDVTGRPASRNVRKPFARQRKNRLFAFWPRFVLYVPLDRSSSVS